MYRRKSVPKGGPFRLFFRIFVNMKRLLFGLGALLLLGACAPQPEPAGSHVDRILAELHDPTSKYVLVASHRGDWRNWPENSIPAIESVIKMGVDIMELDLKLTRDSVLVLCHDHTIDRTTSGKGRVCDITYDSIQRCVLRTGHNVKTSWRMPTLREALAVCKDRIVVNIDQGYEYYDLALAIAEELGVTDQLLIKGKRPAEVVAAKFAEYPHNMMYMPIIDILKPGGRELFESYRRQTVQPLASRLSLVCSREISLTSSPSTGSSPCSITAFSTSSSATGMVITSRISPSPSSVVYSVPSMAS